MSESADPVYLRELLEAGYSEDEVRSWGAVEYYDADGEPYYLRNEIAEWLDAAEGDDP
jgi:hypothetical protein